MIAAGVGMKPARHRRVDKLVSHRGQPWMTASRSLSVPAAVAPSSARTALLEVADKPLRSDPAHRLVSIMHPLAAVVT
jgi:hypothetical protein